MERECLRDSNLSVPLMARRWKYALGRLCLHHDYPHEFVLVIIECVI